MNIIHVPEHTSEGYTMESWYCDGEGEFPRQYKTCKKDLIDLLEKIHVDVFNVLQIKEHIEEIYMWHVASAKYVCESKPSRNVHYCYISIITEGDDVLCHFRID